MTASVSWGTYRCCLYFLYIVDAGDTYVFFELLVEIATIVVAAGTRLSVMILLGRYLYEAMKLRRGQRSIWPPPWAIYTPIPIRGHVIIKGPTVGTTTDTHTQPTACTTNNTCSTHTQIDNPSSGNERGTLGLQVYSYPLYRYSEIE